MVLQSFVLHLSEVDTDIVTLKIYERFELCRDARCFTACWDQQNAQSRTIVVMSISGGSFTISFKFVDNTTYSVDVCTPATNYSSATVVGRPLEENVAHDNIAFEELYLFIHHLNFGLCKLKTGRSCTPLSRLDELEEKVLLLKNVIMDTGTDKQKADYIGAKRKKPT